MFDGPRTIGLAVPNPPYPTCDVCNNGNLLPCVEPATVTVQQSSFAGPGAHGEYKAWMENTIILYWKCSKCNYEIGRK